MMRQSIKEKQLTEVLAPAVEAMGCKLWGCEFNVHGRQGLLRVFIDKENGVTLDDCKRVSDYISPLLDVEDIIKSSYKLEVSSPGFDRPLFTMDQLKQCVNQTIRIKFAYPVEGRRNMTGLLVSIDDSSIQLQVEDSQSTVALAAIDKINVVPMISKGKKKT